jgi:two-component system response regulator FlrC
VKIIVVEDEAPIRVFIANALKYCVNREVHTFGDGTEAWDHLESSQDVDIVISDVDMPGMSGIELLRKIKQKYPSIICILMSGSPANRPLVAENGADWFLPKPFKLADLFQIVQKFVISGS